MGLWKGWTILIDALYVSAQNISFALSLLATPSAEAQEYYQWNVLCYKCFFFFSKKRTENHSFKMFAPGDQAACIGVGEMFVRMHICT